MSLHETQINPSLNLTNELTVKRKKNILKKRKKKGKVLECIMKHLYNKIIFLD